MLRGSQVAQTQTETPGEKHLRAHLARFLEHVSLTGAALPTVPLTGGAPAATAGLPVPTLGLPGLPQPHPDLTWGSPPPPGHMRSCAPDAPLGHPTSAPPTRRELNARLPPPTQGPPPGTPSWPQHPR